MVSLGSRFEKNNDNAASMKQRPSNHSNPVEWDAGAAITVHGDAKAGSQAIAVAMQEQRRALLEANRASKRDLAAMASSVTRPADETGVLDGRNMLREAAHWVSLPHECPCV
eukprot:6469010-Amphidinium_carterae.1